MNYRKLWTGLGLLILLTPLGLLATGTAWGEWAPEEFQRLVGYVPSKMASGAEFFAAPLPDYSIPGLDGGFFRSSLGYYASAILGVGVIVLVTLALGKLVAGKEEDENT